MTYLALTPAARPGICGRGIKSLLLNPSRLTTRLRPNPRGRARSADPRPPVVRPMQSHDPRPSAELCSLKSGRA